MKINPNGTVPAFVHGDTIINQSRDIAKHLATTCSPGSTLYPDDVEIKQKIDDLLAYDSDTIFPIVGKLIGVSLHLRKLSANGFIVYLLIALSNLYSMMN